MASTQTRTCDLCTIQDMSNDAEIWCPNCEEALCTKCKVQHGLAKISKSHKTIKIETYKNLPAFIQKVNQLCRDHEERFEYFCSRHDTACCVRCLKTTHRECHETLTPLGEVIEGFKSSKVFVDLEESVREVMSDLKTISYFQKSNLQSLQEQMKVSEQKVTERRREINDKLDIIENDMRNEISTVFDQNKIVMEDKICDIEAREKRVEDIKKMLEDIKTNASELQTYFGIQGISNDVKKEDEFIQGMLNSENKIPKIDIELEFNDKCPLEREELFGKAQIKTTSTEIGLERGTKAEAQTVVPKNTGTNSFFSFFSRR